MNNLSTHTVAIARDDGGPTNSSAPRWKTYMESMGVQTRGANPFADDFLEQVEGCAGFMWRFGHGSRETEVARRIFPVLETVRGLACYPNHQTRWHFDDKVAQALLLKAHGLPTPPTRVFFSELEAIEYIRCARWPQVIKLAGGAGSSNVRLLRSRREAERVLHALFGRGLLTLNMLDALPQSRLELRERLGNLARSLGLRREGKHLNWLPQRGYLLLQEFLPRNAFDTRVTVIGDRAFAFRRFNRPGDFRSSGSGLIDHNPRGIEMDVVALAFTTARKLGTQSLAIDGLRREGKPVIGEISYTYMSGAVRACPGYWDHTLRWHEGGMWPEEAQATDFVAALHRSSG